MCDKIYFRSEQLATIQEAFNYFDVNGDGLISIDEFKQLLDSLGMLSGKYYLLFNNCHFKDISEDSFEDTKQFFYLRYSQGHREIDQKYKRR